MVAATCLLTVIFVVAGILCLVAAATGAEWFFSSAQSVFGSIPRTAARIAAALLGAAILIMAYVIFRDTFLSL